MKRVVSFPDFPPLVLSRDDELPVGLRLLLRYDAGPDAGKITRAAEDALRAFPHLTGVFREGKIFPAEEGGALLDTGETDVADLRETTSFAELSRRFFPAEETRRLFSLRVTRDGRGGGAWLALAVSHRAVDGTGLGWFFARMRAAIHGFPAPPVRHDRACAEAAREESGALLPDGYRETSAEEAEGNFSRELAMAVEPLVFVVSPADLENRVGAADAIRARFLLTDWLCATAREAEPALDRAAVWCNARGKNLVPPEYTGNAGCYLPLAHDKPVLGGLIALARREGAREIAAAYRAVKNAPHGVSWNGFAEGFIQCNLIPAPSSAADLGTGNPAWGALLTRNSAGLRVTPEAGGKGWIVECSFAPRVLDYFRERARAAFPGTVFWNGGTMEFS